MAQTWVSPFSNFPQPWAQEVNVSSDAVKPRVLESLPSMQTLAIQSTRFLLEWGQAAPFKSCVRDTTKQKTEP